MEAHIPSLGESITQLMVTLLASAAVLSVLVFSLIILRRKGCVAEINVIWYAFSLVFLLWWCLQLAFHLDILQQPFDDELGAQYNATMVEIKQLPDIEKNKYDSQEQMRLAGQPVDDEFKRRRQLEQKLADLGRRLADGEPWTVRYVHLKVREYLTDTRAEIGAVAIFLIVTVGPQLMNYILSGLSGCAATPRYVWQFEKIAIWSLIKFLAAFGGLLVADALSFYQVTLFRDARAKLIIFIDYVSHLPWGLGAVALAFVTAVCQVYTLEAAQALGSAWQQKPGSLPIRLHRFFTRNVSQTRNKY
ncbi:hypothetical protein [Bradyrhizobium oligotrophicum]|uniref:hypothetical protein n=1 Tax=Bradyrhizobium oligotrophicum TaxID=44255 RepID=UPI0005A6B899|nr:hypothetical protein [Bradyrhizobium oligotrophicum]